MGLEVFTGYINALNSDNPTNGDAKQAGDDHIRGIKLTLKTTFPNFTGAVTASNASINAGIFAANTRQIFYQQSAPTGWSADTGVHDAALRVVSSGLTGGSTNYVAGISGMATIFGADKQAGYTALTTAQIPAHTHGVGTYAVSYAGGHTHTVPTKRGTGFSYGGVGSSLGDTDSTTSVAGIHVHTISGSSASAGSGGGHTHTLNLNLYYADVIIARKTV